MLKIQDGQCGKCEHFGEESSNSKLVQLRVNGQVDPSEIADVVEPCGLPENASRGLKVTPLGSCAGFTPMRAAG